MKSFLATITIVLFFSVSLIGQWTQQLELLFDHPDIANAQLAISVKDMDGTILYEKDSEVLLVPASTLKTITTMSAIGILGGEYQYQTVMSYTGEITEDGTLYGNIIVKGSGDPSLGSVEDHQVPDMFAVINRMTKAIRDKGIKCINGYILLDDTVFDDEAVHPGWPWDDLCNYYAAGIWGINLNENRYKITFDRSPNPNVATSVSSISPRYPGLTLENRVSTGALGSYDDAYIYGDPYGLKRVVRGTIPPGQGGFEIEGAVPDGSLYLGDQLSKMLDAAGIGVKGYMKQKAEEDGITLLTISSARLRDLAKFALEESDNMYCDVFLKTIGSNNGKVGTWDSGVEGVKSFVASLGVSTDGYKQVDGSGLSARNRISSSFNTSFLLAQIDKIGIQQVKYLLPRVGESGTVKNFLNGYEAQDKAWLKSGSISSVVAYTGILEINNAPVAISISANGHQKGNRAARRQLEKIINEIYLGLKK